MDARPDAGQVHDEASLAAFLGELEAVLHDLSVRTALCWWEKYTGGPGSELNELERQRSEILLDPAYGALARDWSDRRLADPLLARKVRVLEEMILVAGVNSAPEVYSLANSIMDRVVAFEPVVWGRAVSNSERVRLLRESPDRALRREAWLAVSPLSMEVAADTVELIRRRNARAVEAGYPDYAEMALAVAELSRDEILGLLSDLERMSAAPYGRFLLKGAGSLGLDQLEPWDIGHLLDREMAIPTEPFPRSRLVPNLKEFVWSFGAGPAALAVDFVIRDIPFGGLCVPVDPPSDVRVLANPQDGHRYYSTLYHEYGHGLHAVYAGGNSYLLQDEAGAFCEGMAEVWAYFTYHPRWLRDLGLDDSLADAVVRTQQLGMMTSHRSLAADVAWDLEAYRNPGQDLTGLAAASEARYLGVRPRPVHRWAGGPFPSGYPIYRQNYILADLIAGATHRALREGFGEDLLGNPRVFESLAQGCWCPGAARPWREKLRAFTGRDLDASAVAYAGSASAVAYAGTASEVSYAGSGGEEPASEGRAGR